MDYYKVLGVSSSATQDEIKAAYRKMAMKHHPDRGGDANKFKEIEEAYRTLSDENTRYEYDNPNQGFQGFGNTHDFFNSMFGAGPHFGFGFQQARKNSNVMAHVSITLEEVLTGKTIDAEIGFRNGGKKLVSINIPAGVDDGIQIRYPGMGDQSDPKMQAGDLLVNVRVMPHPKFQRSGNDLITEHEISVWEALLGSSLTLETLDKKTFTITVPAGSQPETVLSCKGEGLPHPRSGHRGNLLIKIRIKIPKNLSQSQKEVLEKLKNEF